MKYRINLQKYRGISLIWVVLTFIVVLTFGGLMLDWAHVLLAGHQLHNAADSAALAGARYVVDPASPTPGATARTIAQTYGAANLAIKTPVNLLANTGNAPDGDIVIGRYYDDTRTFTPTLSYPNAMKVISRKDGISNPRMPLLFGSMFGVAQKNLIQKYAIAKIYNASGAAVIATSPDGTGLYLHGNPDIQIDNGGSIYANSVEIDDAVDVRGNPHMEVSEINVVGGLDISGGFDIDTDLAYDGLPGSLNTGVDPIEDPFNNADYVLPEPDLQPISPTAPVDNSLLQIGSGAHTLLPGYYPGGVKITGGTVIMAPGIYQIGGLGLSMTGGVTTASEVMFHITAGAVDIRGNTNLTLTPPSSGTYENISLFQSRANHEDAEINGGGGLDMTGVLYFPENHLWVAGNGDTIGTQLIADTIEIAGNGTIYIPWNGSPQVVDKSYLVE